MSIRRFTGLTHAFSKRIENYAHMMAIYFMHYKFRAHPSDPKGHSRDGGWHHLQALGNV
jgi:hypothetical protein